MYFRVKVTVIFKKLLKNSVPQLGNNRKENLLYFSSNGF